MTALLDLTPRRPRALPPDMPEAWAVIGGSLVDLTRWDVQPGDRAAVIVAPNKPPQIVTIATSNELGPRDRYAATAMPPLGRLKVYVLGRVIGGGA